MTRIFLIGYMGCGKTTLGKILAEKTTYVFVDLDTFIEEKYHKTVSQIFAEMGQDKFREIERDCLAEVCDFEQTIIATGGGTPCYYDNLQKMNDAGLTVYIQLTIAQLCARLETSRAGKRPLIADKKGEELQQFIQEGLKAREPFYKQAKLKVSGSDNDIVDQIIKVSRL